MSLAEVVGSKGAAGVVAVAALVGLIAAARGASAVDPRDATWHIGFVEVWGKTDRGEGRNLDLYAVFEGGKFARAVGTARRFNKSAHLVEKGDIKVDGDKVSGTLHIVVTPDAWVPADGRPIDFHVEFEGKLVREAGAAEQRLTGRYKGTIGGRAISGSLAGGVGATETDWDDCAWTVRLNPVLPPDVAMQPMLQITVGVADGKVQWADVGRAFKGPRPRAYLFDGAGLALDGATVRGKVTLPARAVDVAADPKAVAELDTVIHRVQGLIGGKAKVTFKRDGRTIGEQFVAYGRGTAAKGNGKRDPNEPKPLWRYGLDTRPWWVPVKRFTAPQAGEHPRLFFRRSDLAGLRKRVATPTGQAILKRLRVLLNGSDGESLPTRYGVKGPVGSDGGGKFANDPPGTYTISHVAGYGLLYQVTGDRKYAELGKKCMQTALEGQRDRDRRYSFKAPYGPLRAGTSLGWYAVGYDLCYDGWDEAFRKRVAQEIQNYNEGPEMSLAELVHGSIIPGSNHYGMQVGGGALALLAIMNDPGVDMSRIGPLLEDSEKSMITQMAHGWGDHGFFAEGDGTGSMSAHIAFLPALQAWRTAAGKDYVSPRPHAQWMTLKWILQTIIHDGKIEFPRRGGYPHNIWARQGLSGGGYFAEGFATLPEDKGRALLWFYDRFLKAHDQESGTPYDTASLYPHIAVLSFINWPLGVEPVNPQKVMPRAVADTVYGFFANRNRWQDADDVLITYFLNLGPQGYIGVKEGGRVNIWGLGVRTEWMTGLAGAQPIFWEAAENGSSVLSVAKWDMVASLCVDLSGASGAPAMLVGVGPLFAASGFRPTGEPGGATLEVSEVTAGGHKFVVLTLQKGEAPKPTADGNAVRIGNQTVRFDGKRIILKTF